MKLNRLETHDRFQHFTSQSFDITQCCQDLINQRPFGNFPFYIFSHARSLQLDEKMKLFVSGKFAKFENVPDKTIIWQPRLTKPKAQTNSMLFKAYPGSDVIKIIWIIPDRALWDQYKIGNITENKTVLQSISDFQNNLKKLEERESDDLTDAQIDAIYAEISKSASRNKLMYDLYV